jgi:predicted Rossmann fold flavoprotein
VDIRLSHRITDVSRGEAFRVETDQGGFSAPALVIATGGLSIPKMGATGFAYDLAGRFGLALTGVRPALVPLTFGGDDLALMQPLSGVALPVRAVSGKAAFREAMLFTHRGLSGPAILQVSSYWQPGAAIEVDLFDGADGRAALLAGKAARPNAMLRSLLGEVLPQRLAQALAPGDAPVGQMRDRVLSDLAGGLARWRLMPVGTEGYAKAEVTAGGVDTAALSQRTLEAKAVPGLFVIGEAVDVTGWLGGYNFQWAWASGFCAGGEV